MSPEADVQRTSFLAKHAIIRIKEFIEAQRDTFGTFAHRRGKGALADLRSAVEAREGIARRFRLSRGRHWMALATLLLTSACDPSRGSATQTPSAGEWRAFEGTWTAAGTRRTLHLGLDQRAAIFELTGSLLLSGEQRPAVGFRAQAIGFSDSRAGMQGRCVWTDEHGESVYSELKGEWVGSGNHIVGTFVGGTGRFAGVTGEYTFQWQYVVDAEDGAVSGRVVDLKGRALFGPPATAPAAETGR